MYDIIAVCIYVHHCCFKNEKYVKSIFRLHDLHDKYKLHLALPQITQISVPQK